MNYCVLVNYFSVLGDIVKSIVPEDEQADFVMTLGLPSMLELGCSDPEPPTHGFSVQGGVFL